jgi:hypothetical protein
VTPNEPPSPNDDPNPATEHDALRRLEERLDRASDAAERLISEAARAAAAARTRAGEPAQPDGDPGDPAVGTTGGPGEPEARNRGDGETSRGDGESGKPPPAGWQLPRTDGSQNPRSPDVELLAGVLQSLRDLIPPDLQERLTAALRELLLALRALIDWYIERMERRRAQPTEVEDIPIL